MRVLRPGLNLYGDELIRIYELIHTEPSIIIQTLIEL